MVTKVMPIYHAEFVNRDQRSATDGAKKKSQQRTPFQEVFLKELENIGKIHVSKK